VSSYNYYKSGWTERVYGNSNLFNIMSGKLAEYDPASRNNIIIFDGSILYVKPFVLRRADVSYINPETIIIDISGLEPDVYRIMAIHNFLVEDCNPRLHECLAGIFLSRKRVGRWEQAEDHPRECRTLEFLATINTLNNQLLF